MWTGTIAEVTRADDKRQICYNVVYTNGQVKESRRHSVNPPDALAVIQGQIVQYEAVDAALNTPPQGLGVGDVIIAPKAPDQPPDDPERDAFSAALRVLRRLQRGVGIVPDQTIANQLADVAGLWKPGYEDLL